MRHIISSFLLINAFLSGFAQQINTDAIVKFWQVVDNLKQDRPLDDSLWNAYYDLKGNRNYMEFVFRPSLADSLHVLEEGHTKASDDILDNLLYIKENEQQLRSYTRQI